MCVKVYGYEVRACDWGSVWATKRRTVYSQDSFSRLSLLLLSIQPNSHSHHTYLSMSGGLRRSQEHLLGYRRKLCERETCTPFTEPMSLCTIPRRRPGVGEYAQAPCRLLSSAFPPLWQGFLRQRGLYRSLEKRNWDLRKIQEHLKFVPPFAPP